MQSLITVVELLSIFLLTYMMGLGLTKMLLPHDIEEEFGVFITPTIGYLIFCLVAFTISSSFKLMTTTTCYATMFALLSVSLLTQLKSAWRVSPIKLATDSKQALLLMLPMALMILWPLLYYGAQTYLGAVNPDFFAGVVDNYYLMNSHSVADFMAAKDTYFPIDYMAGTVSVSARFGAGVLGILVQLLSHESTRTALTLIIGFFLLNIPLIMYFFSSMVLGFNRRQATYSAWLIGISAPTAMSYLYYYLGQNSGLPVLPLVLTSAYLMLVRPSLKTLILCALLANALFINYFAMLPYALAPAGVLGLYLLFSRQLSIIRAVGLVLGFLVVFIALHLGNVATIVASMQAWGHVIGQTLQGQFFLEFLTELFVPFVFGVVEYPASNSLIINILGGDLGKLFALIVTASILVFWIWSLIRWTKNTKEMTRKVFVVSAVLIYFSVWWYYSFPRQYAYAVFKMSSWLQFMLVPFIVYGFWQVVTTIKSTAKKTYLTRAYTTLGYTICVTYVVCNIIATGQYGYNGLGRNIRSGYIVNNFEMSGNRDYFALQNALGKFVKPDQSVMVLFTDSIQNYWASYYLKDFRLSIPFHQEMPGDDENLPDVRTNMVMDYYGDLRLATNYLAHDYHDNYILTWNKDHLNQDIVNPNYSSKPVWEDHTFRLFDIRNTYDVLATGRGFYRLEYIPRHSYWMPRTMRWSAHGGEFYLVNPKNPGKPYRFGVDVLMGYEAPSNSRTLELWLNGKMVESIIVTDSARVITKPFYPVKGINKLVVHVKENNGAIKRNFALWNNDIPNDYRHMNVIFANAKIISPTSPSDHRVITLNQPIDYIKLFDDADSFNGMQQDGWIGDFASFTFTMPTTVKQMELKGKIEGDFGFTFPYKIAAKINGTTYTKTVDKAGDFTLNFPVVNRGEQVDVVLNPSQSIQAGNPEQRHKILRQSFRINSINFLS